MIGEIHPRKKKFYIFTIGSIILVFCGLVLLTMVFSSSNSNRGKFGKRWKDVGSVHRRRNGVKAVDPNRKMRIVFFSDTHQRHWEYDAFPEGDVLFFAGDFSTKGDVGEILRFNEWMMKLPYSAKIVISGNHDFSPPNKMDRVFTELELDDMLGCCTFIHEREAILNPGNIKVYGTSFMANMWKYLKQDRPGFVSYDNQYYFHTEEELMDIYSKIPNDVDILMTHQPPSGILDLDPPNNKGSVSLRHYVDNFLMDLSLHFFGHIHCQNGFERKDLGDGREVMFINGAIAPPGTVGWRTDSLAYTFDYFY